MSCVTWSCSFLYEKYRVQIQVLFCPKGNVVSSFMQMRHSADLKCWQLVTWPTSYACPPACRGHAAGCLSGAARTAPTLYTTHSMSIRKEIESKFESKFESKSKANENERRRMQEMPHYTSTWIGCHVRPNKQRNWSGDQLLHKAKASTSFKKRSFVAQSIGRAYCLINVVIVTTIGGSWLWKLEGLEQYRQLQWSKFMVTAFDLHSV